MRAGIGFDAHRYIKGRDLVLGGVKIPYSLGLEGWSDADVLTHAIADAVLGAGALGDLGEHFPPGDPAYEDIPGLVILEKVAALLDDHGYVVVNIDVVVILEEPRISEYREDMRYGIASVFGIGREDVSIKATTTEGMGFAGRKEGVAAMAVALVDSKD